MTRWRIVINMIIDDLAKLLNWKTYIIWLSTRSYQWCLVRIPKNTRKLVSPWWGIPISEEQSVVNSLWTLRSVCTKLSTEFSVYGAISTVCSVSELGCRAGTRLRWVTPFSYYFYNNIWKYYLETQKLKTYCARFITTYLLGRTD